MKTRLFLLIIFILAMLIQPFYPAYGQQRSLTIEQMQTGISLLQGQSDYLGRIIGQHSEKRLLITMQIDNIKKQLQAALRAKADADKKLQESHKKSLEGAAKDSAKGDGGE